MTKAERAEMDTVLATLKTEFAAAMKAALEQELAPYIVAINGLEQRSSNFAARVNAHNKAYRAEIAHLRDQVDALTPKAKAPPADRISPKAWDDAMAVLKTRHPGKTFFAPSEVRGVAATMAATAPVAEDEDVTL